MRAACRGVAAADSGGGCDLMVPAGEALRWVGLAIPAHGGGRVPPGEVRELRTRSGSNMAGYGNLPEATAKTLGPSDWGWPAYFDTNVAGDSVAHGHVPLDQWDLQRRQAYGQQHGVAILDYFAGDLYPQGPDVPVGPGGGRAGCCWRGGWTPACRPRRRWSRS